MGVKTQYNRKNFQNKLPAILFFGFVAIIVTGKIQLFLSVNIHYIDSDQPFMWAGAADYAKGLFYEPRFYGQNYNTFMEGLFAVPFLWLGVPVYYALPVATHFIYLFPFLFAALYLFFNGKQVNGLFVLLLIICLPTAYDILNSLPRGFVTPNFFSSFFIISLLYPQRKVPMLLNFFMLVLGYFVSPNSLLIGLPFAAFMLFHNYKNKWFYFTTILSALCYVPFYYLFDDFYQRYPSYIVYGYKHGFSFNYLFESLCHLGQTFVHVSFFTENSSLPLIVVIALLAAFLYRYNRKAFFSFIIFLVPLIFMFSTGKSRDGRLWPWYSYSRLYLGLPLLIGLFFAFVPMQLKKTTIAIVVVALLFSGVKFFNFTKNLAKQTNKDLWLGVHLVPLQAALDGMKLYKEACNKQQVDFFLISNGFWLSTFLNYGGPAVHGDFPQTEETNSERRYRVREANNNKVISRFVFLSCRYRFDTLVPASPGFELQRLDDYGLLLVKNNTLKMGDFMRKSVEYEATK